jgi:plasmid stabilization system protein ParE
MMRVVVLAEAAEDLESAQNFYNRQAAGVGDYCLKSLLADIESLSHRHGIHRRQYGCFRMLGSRFPFGIYYLDTENETRVVAVLDLRRDPSWIRSRMKERL